MKNTTSLAYRKRVKISRDWLFFCLVALAAALFRCTRLDLIEFKADEAINLFLAMRVKYDGILLPGGTVSSAGLLNPPLFNYLLVPGLYLTDDPRIISGLIGLTNSLGVGFLYLLMRRFMKTAAALASSLLLALSPWAVLFSRKIWTQDLILPAMVACLFGFHWIIAGKKNTGFLVLIASQLWIGQLHQASVLFFIPLDLYLLWRRVRPPLAAAVAGLFLGLLPVIPYFWYLWVNWDDKTAFLVVKDRFTAGYFWENLLRPFQILHQGNFFHVLGNDVIEFAGRYPAIYRLKRLFYLEYPLLAGGMILYWQKYSRYRILAAAVFCLPFFYLLLRFPPFMHYFLILTPLLFMFLGVALDRLFSSGIKLIRLGTGAAFSALMILSVVYNLAFYRLVDDLGGLKGDYGLGYRQSLKEKAAALARFRGRPEEGEIIAASFIPSDIFDGRLPVAQMIFDFSGEAFDLAGLQQSFESEPEDARLRLKLSAYYTTPPLSVEKKQNLDARYRLYPGVYERLYRDVSESYRQTEKRTN